jgi:hypothetical protein
MNMAKMAPTIIDMRSSPNGMVFPFSANTDGHAADGQAAESAADEVQESHGADNENRGVVLRIPPATGDRIL